MYACMHVCLYVVDEYISVCISVCMNVCLCVYIEGTLVEGTWVHMHQPQQIHHVSTREIQHDVVNRCQMMMYYPRPFLRPAATLLTAPVDSRNSLGWTLFLLPPPFSSVSGLLGCYQCNFGAHVALDTVALLA